ncbi:MAG: hypothetical protein PHH04_01340 [Thomasclavelia sp.]|nr:hypothetical protein [Thomasclavelia sp.]
MSRIDRKIERQKQNNSYTINEKDKEKTKKDFFTDNFSFKWIDLSIRSVIYMLLDFLAVSILFIPLITNVYGDAKLAFILCHTFITSLLVVVTFIVTKKDTPRPKPTAILLRYLFTAVLLFAVSVISVNLIG